MSPTLKTANQARQPDLKHRFTASPRILTLSFHNSQPNNVIMITEIFIVNRMRSRTHCYSATPCQYFLR